jgi:hypothetical protein
VIVDVVDWLAVTDAGVVDVIVMSGDGAEETWKVAVVEWAVAPPVAVTVTA